MSAEWQPIETAPRDGTPILGYSPGWPGRSSDERFVCWWLSARDEWCMYDGGENGPRIFRRPTSWQALPNCSPQAGEA